MRLLQVRRDRIDPVASLVHLPVRGNTTLPRAGAGQGGEIVQALPFSFMATSRSLAKSSIL